MSEQIILAKERFDFLTGNNPTSKNQTLSTLMKLGYSTQQVAEIASICDCLDTLDENATKYKANSALKQSNILKQQTKVLRTRLFKLLLEKPEGEIKAKLDISDMQKVEQAKESSFHKLKKKYSTIGKDFVSLFSRPTDENNKIVTDFVLDKYYLPKDVGNETDEKLSRFTIEHNEYGTYKKNSSFQINDGKKIGVYTLQNFTWGMLYTRLNELKLQINGIEKGMASFNEWWADNCYVIGGKPYEPTKLGKIFSKLNDFFLKNFHKESSEVFEFMHQTMMKKLIQEKGAIEEEILRRQKCRLFAPEHEIKR